MRKCLVWNVAVLKSIFWKVICTSRMSRIPPKKPAVFLEMQHLFGPVVSIFQRIFHTFQSVMQNSWNQRSSWIMMLKSSKTQKKSANTQRFGLTNNIYTSVIRGHPTCRQIWIHQGDSPPNRHWEVPMGGGLFEPGDQPSFCRNGIAKKRRNSGFARQGPKMINIVISRRNGDGSWHPGTFCSPQVIAGLKWMFIPLKMVSIGIDP